MIHYYSFYYVPVSIILLEVTSSVGLSLWTYTKYKESSDSI